MSIIQEVKKLTHSYAAKGGSDNRKQQISRMIAFSTFVRGEGVNSLGQVGKAQVIRYWKVHRHLSDATLYSHWRAIAILWQLADKVGEPPRPRLASNSKSTSDIAEEPSINNVPENYSTPGALNTASTGSE